MEAQAKPEGRPGDILGRFNLERCLGCGACAGSCPITGTSQPNPAGGLDVRQAMRLIAMGYLDEVAASNLPWYCNGCGRCAEGCPAGIDIPAVMGALKGLRPRNKVPGVLVKGLANAIKSGNNLAVPRQDYFFLLKDLGEELEREDCPGFHVPVDRPGADLAVFPNSKEVFVDNEDMKWWWKIFYAARENWTVPSENWESVDWGLFTGDTTSSRELARRKVEFIKRLGIGRLLMPDCGGASYGCRQGLAACNLAT